MELHPVRAMGPRAWNELSDWLLRVSDRYTSVHVLVDRTTHECVLPRFMAEIDGLADAHILEIEPGEASKELALVEQLALGLRDTLLSVNLILLHDLSKLSKRVSRQGN
jgi:hypothetical protein